jgi:hypothetical protein
MRPSCAVMHAQDHCGLLEPMRYGSAKPLLFRPSRAGQRSRELRQSLSSADTAPNQGNPTGRETTTLRFPVRKGDFWKQLIWATAGTPKRKRFLCLCVAPRWPTKFTDLQRVLCGHRAGPWQLPSPPPGQRNRGRWWQAAKVSSEPEQISDLEQSNVLSCNLGITGWLRISQRIELRSEPCDGRCRRCGRDRCGRKSAWSIHWGAPVELSSTLGSNCCEQNDYRLEWPRM